MLLRWIADSPTTCPSVVAEHEIWLHGVVMAVDGVLLIVEQDGSPVASVHCDQIQGGVWRSNAVIAPKWRSHGFLTEVFLAAENFLVCWYNVQTLMTTVYREDRATVLMVQGAGFVVRHLSPQDSSFVEFVKQRWKNSVSVRYDKVPHHTPGMW